MDLVHSADLPNQGDGIWLMMPWSLPLSVTRHRWNSAADRFEGITSFADFGHFIRNSHPSESLFLSTIIARHIGSWKRGRERCKAQWVPRKRQRKMQGTLGTEKEAEKDARHIGYWEDAISEKRSFCKWQFGRCIFLWSRFTSWLLIGSARGRSSAHLDVNTNYGLSIWFVLF